MLTFDSASHTYYWNGQVVPGVSEIMKAVGLSRDYSKVDTFYRDRGVAAHRAIELFLKGTLDPSTLDPVVGPYFEAFKKFWAKHGYKV